MCNGWEATEGILPVRLHRPVDSIERNKFRLLARRSGMPNQGIPLHIHEIAALWNPLPLVHPLGIEVAVGEQIGQVEILVLSHQTGSQYNKKN